MCRKGRCPPGRSGCPAAAPAPTPPPQPRARPPRPTFCRSARQHLLEIFCRDTRHLHNSTVTILVWDYFDQPGKRAEHHVSFAVQGLERGATNSAPVWCLPLLAEHPRRRQRTGNTGQLRARAASTFWRSSSLVLRPSSDSWSSSQRPRRSLHGSICMWSITPGPFS